MDAALTALLRRLLGPGRPEVPCDTCFAELDRYVELEISGADPEAAVPGLAAHLDGCPACREDHDSLVAVLTHLAAGQPPPTVRRRPPC